MDHEFSDLLKQAERTLVVDKRREIMCKLEDIQQERGSVGIAFYTKVWNIWNKKFQDGAAPDQLRHLPRYVVRPGGVGFRWALAPGRTPKQSTRVSPDPRWLPEMAGSFI